MAVKHRDAENPRKMDLALLATYIQNLTEQLTFFPPPDPVSCASLVNFLAHVPVPKDGMKQALFVTHVKKVEDQLQFLLVDVEASVREEIVFSILKEVYLIISKDKDTEASPMTCVVLALVEPPTIRSAINWLIRGGRAEDVPESSPGKMPVTNSGLRNVLLTLCNWLCFWSTPVLCNWVLTFLEALEDVENYDVLMDVSMDVISPMFETLFIPEMRSTVSNIFLHMLASTRRTTEAFEKIASRVPSMLEGLASDSQPGSRSLLQKLVDALASLFVRHPDLKTQFPDIVKCLDAHFKSIQCILVQYPEWKNNQATEEHEQHMVGLVNLGNTCYMNSLVQYPEWKNNQVTGEHEQHMVGLVNLGNTCYMNSVLQALLMTRPFSNAIIMTKGEFNLISKLGKLFGMLTYSVRPCLNPKEFYMLSKPSNFEQDSQHDSSEFLSYLLECIHLRETVQFFSQGSSSEENDRDRSSALLSTASSEDAQEGRSSPTPGCSRASSATAEQSSSKRAAKRRFTDSEDENASPHKQHKGLSGLAVGTMKNGAQTIVQKSFGGMLTTSITCSQCGFTSRKQDYFRDLQLAFPSNHHNTRTRREYYSVQELLDFYCSVENLIGDNQYYCQRCECLRDAERSIALDQAPKNLILVLKHFIYDPKTLIRAKLLHRVDHNQTIEVKEGPNLLTYELYAAVVHSGTQIDSGHYYTLARDGPKNWYKFNDHWVSMCSEQELHNLSPPNTPYILFYRQRRNRLEAAGDGEMPFDSLEDKLPFAYLPLHLKEQIRSDNILYKALHKRETRFGRSKARQTYRDSDEDPPSTCSYSGYRMYH